MFKKTSHKIAIAIILLIIILTGMMMVRKSNYIDMTQFRPSTSSQMMGYAIETKNRKLIVIDGGTPGDAPELEEFILNHGGKIDAWFITHPHIDHAGAFETIVKNNKVDIDKIYLSIENKEWYEEKANEPERLPDVEAFLEVIKSEEIKQKIVNPQMGETISIDNVKATILGIDNPEIVTGNAINNSSMVIRMQVNQKRILFLGDTGKESCEKLMKQYSEKELRAEIVQVSHHGQNGATKEFYQKVNPEICLWPTPEWLWENNSNGEEDSGPWKTKETRAWMEELKVKQNYVAKDGTHTIRIF